MTDEDFDCWLWVLHKWRSAHGSASGWRVDRILLEQDRRDAVLFNWAIRRRLFLREMGYRLELRNFTRDNIWQQWGGVLS